MENIQKLSSYLKTTFQILTFAVPVFICLLWLLLEWTPCNNAIKEGMFLEVVTTPEGIVNLATHELTPVSKLIGCFAYLLGSLPYILGYISLKTLFQNYQRNNIFTSANTKIYKRIGWLAFLNGIFFIPITQTLMVLAVTLSNSPGHRYITVGFGTPSLESILCGLLVVVIALVMQEAQALQEENQLTV